MEAPRLTSGSVKEIAELRDGPGTIQPVLQVADVRPVTAKGAGTAERFRMLVSDGVHSLQSMLSTDLNRLVTDGALRPGSLVHLLDIMCSTIQGRRIVIVRKLDVLQSECPMIGKPKIYDKKSLHEVQEPNLQANAVAPRVEQVANNLSYGGPVNGVHGTEHSSMSRTTRSGIYNVVPGSSYCTMSAQNTMHTNAVQPNPQQPLPNSHQNQRLAVPGTAGGFGPPDNICGRPAQPLYQQPPPPYKNSGPVAKNEAAPRVTPISALNPFQGTWKIKARVTAKTHVKHYTNAKGPGKLFTFDLLDAHGGEIRAKCFKEAVDQFYDLIEVDKVYLVVSRGGLQPTQRQYNSLNSDYEISLNASTSVEVCSGDDSSIPRQQLNFRQISEIANMDKGVMVDLLGVVTSVSPTFTLKRKNGGETQKRVLELKDMSGCSVEATLWGDFCDAEGQQLQLLRDSGSNPILALKSGLVGDFNGRTVGTISSSYLKINPDFPDAEILRQWYMTEGKNAAFTSLSGGMSSMGRTDVRKTVAQIKDDELGKSEKPDWITVMGAILDIKTETFCYPACTAEVNGTRCTKKVTNNGDGMWQCNGCEQSSQNCEYRYMLQCKIQDHTGTTMYHATAFQEAGEEIVGLPAQDLFRIRHEEQDEEKFAEIIQRARFQLYVFKLRVKEETYLDEARVKCNIVKAQKLQDTAKESRFLLGVIDTLLAEDGLSSSPAMNGAGSVSTGLTYNSNNTYAMNMSGPNQFGQQASLSGRMPTTPSATRYAQTCSACGSNGHSVQNCPAAAMDMQQPVAGGGFTANSYGPSAGNVNTSSGILQQLPPSSRLVDDHTTEMQSRTKLLIWDTHNIVAYVVDATSSSTTGSYRELWRPRAGQRPFYHRGMRLVGTCNGLLCLCDSERTPRSAITVVNPATGETLPVPPLASAGQFFGCPCYDRKRWHEPYSFAYHPITGRYKLVRVPCRFGRLCELNTIHVFTLGETMWWNVPVGAGDARCNLAAGVVSVDGTTFWVRVTASGVAKVVSFDLGEEHAISTTTTTMPMPTVLAKGDSYHLTEVHGRLGFVKGGHRTDVWVLEEGRRWSRRYNLGQRVPRPQFAYSGQCVLTVHNRSSFRAHWWKGKPLSSGWRLRRDDGVVRIGDRDDGTLVADIMPGANLDYYYQTFAYVETREPLNVYASN